MNEFQKGTVTSHFLDEAKRDCAVVMFVRGLC